MRIKKSLFFTLFIFSGVFCNAQKTDTAKHSAPCIAISNAFSPEDDGWGIMYNCEIVKFHIDIYNRWGELLFKSDSLDAIHSSLSAKELPYTAYVNWDYSKLPADNYVYKIKVTFKIEGKESEHQYTGTVMYIK